LISKQRDFSLTSFLTSEYTYDEVCTSLKVSRLNNVNNPNSVHGLYPYRGKISSVEARNIISQMKKGSTLLDPFCGSGTIIYEGYCHGLNTIGTDMNPLAYILSRGKMSLVDIDREQTIRQVHDLVMRAKNDSSYYDIPESCLKAFHEKTGQEVMKMAQFFPEMSDYVKAVFFGAIGLSARGCNHYLWTSTTVGKDVYPKQYINFYDKFIAKARKHLYPLKSDGSTLVYSKDARQLSEFISEGSVDYIFTSPPYFDALDYTAYYARFIFSILGWDSSIKKQLIQNVKTYEEDMKKVLAEIIKVTADNALIIFVVGDKKYKDEIINGGKFFSSMLHHEPANIIEREYSNTPSSGIFDLLNKTKRKEQIVIWDKSTW
jgi:DNA modification methylase